MASSVSLGASYMTYFEETCDICMSVTVHASILLASIHINMQNDCWSLYTVYVYVNTFPIEQSRQTAIFKLYTMLFSPTY